MIRLYNFMPCNIFKIVDVHDDVSFTFNMFSK